MTKAFLSTYNGFLGCPGDADDWAKRFCGIYERLVFPGQPKPLYYWQKDFDTFNVDAAKPSQYHVPEIFSSESVPTFILFSKALGTPLRQPTGGWGEISTWLKQPGVGFDEIALFGEGDFLDIKNVPDGKVPLTGTLYELLEAIRSGQSGLGSNLRIIRIEAPDAEVSVHSDTATTTHFQQQRKWLEQILGNIGKSYPIIPIKNEADFDSRVSDILRAAFKIPKLNPLTDPLPSLEALSGNLGALLFGRSELIGKLNHRIFQDEEPLTLITGVSGAGKSSLLRAGLIEAWYKPSPPGAGYQFKAHSILVEPRSLVLDEYADPTRTLLSFIVGQNSGKDSSVIGPLPSSFVEIQVALPKLASGDLNADLLELLDWWGSNIPTAHTPLILIIDQAEQVEAIARAEARLREEQELAPDAEAQLQLPANWKCFTAFVALLTGCTDPSQFDQPVLDKAQEVLQRRPIRVILGLHRLSTLAFWPLGQLPIETEVPPLASRNDWQQIITETFDAYGFLPEDALVNQMVQEATSLADRQAPLPNPAAFGDKVAHTQASVLPQVVTALQRIMTRWREIHENKFSRVEDKVLYWSIYGRVCAIANAIEALGEAAWQNCEAELAIKMNQNLRGLLGPAQVRSNQDRRFGRLMGGLVDVTADDNHELAYIGTSSPLAQSEELLINALKKQRFLTSITGQYLRLPHRSIIDHWPRAFQWVDDTAAPNLKLKSWLKIQKRLCGHQNLPPLEQTKLRSLVDLTLDWMGSDIGHDKALHDWLDEKLVDLFEPRDTDFHSFEVMAGLPFLALQNSHFTLAKSLFSKCLSYEFLSQIQKAQLLAYAASEGADFCIEDILDRNQDIRSELSNYVDCVNGMFPLLLASQNGHIRCVELLLEAGADPSHSEKEHGIFPLLQAAWNGHADCVIQLLAAGVDPNQVCSGDGTFPLFMAAQHGHVDCVLALLNGNANPHQQIRANLLSPLLQAAAFGHTEIVSILLLAGADVNRTCNSGSSPLMLAAEGGHIDCVEMLLEKGADPNQMNTRTGLTPLMFASQNGHIDCVRRLLAAQATVDLAMPKNDVTALGLAAGHGQSACLALLIEAGADVNRVNTKLQNFPLLTAAQFGRTECVDVLLKAGANPHQKSPSDGYTALMLAAQNGHSLCVKLLIEAKSDIQACASNGTFPLLLAALRGRRECVELLISAGANPSQKTYINGEFPLFVAAQEGQDSCLSLLLKCGADPNQFTKNGNCAVIAAAQNGNDRCLSALIDAGATTDVIFALDGSFPLLLAAQQGHEKCVNLLLASGSNVHMRDQNQGGFPLLLASQGGNPDCVKILLENGALHSQENTKTGYFPLLMAAELGHLECVKALLAAGANPNQISLRNSRYPLLVAEAYNEFSVKHSLIAHGANPQMLASQFAKNFVRERKINNFNNKKSISEIVDYHIKYCPIPGNWHLANLENYSFLPQNAQLINVRINEIYNKNRNSLHIIHSIFSHKFDDKISGIFDAFHILVNKNALFDMSHIEEKIFKLSEDGFKFDFYDLKDRKIIAAAMLLSPNRRFFPVLEGTPLPILPNKFVNRIFDPEERWRPWQNVQGPEGTALQLPWIEGNRLICGEILLPEDGKGIRILERRKVLTTSEFWQVPQWIDQSGTFYRQLNS